MSVVFRCLRAMQLSFSVFEHGASLVKRVVIRFICVCFVRCSVTRSEGGWTAFRMDLAMAGRSVFSSSSAVCIGFFQATRRTSTEYQVACVLNPRKTKKSKEATPSLFIKLKS